MNVPKLRFPEFWDAGDWEEKRLGVLAEKISDGIHSTPIYDENGQYYFVNGNNLTDNRIEINESTKRVGEAEYLKYRTELSTQTILISINGTIGNLAFFNGEKVILGKSACYINLKTNENKYFIFNLLKTSSITSYFEKELTGSTIKNLSLTSIKNAKAFFPIPAEQQKIADCLSSISDRITAETQKLDTLKAHKKGLMQQLFPAESETLPKLRFPEFHDAEEWEENPLGNKTIKVGSGITPNGGEKNYKRKGRPFIRSQNIGWGCLLLDDVAFIDDVTHSKFSATEINEGDVFLNITGASIGRSAVADYRVQGGNVNQHVCIIRTKKIELNSYYLNQYLLSQYGQRQIDSFQAGGNRQGLNFAQVRSFSLPLPLIKEQKKIADCLSSLDELIAAQAQAIDTLKTHKKGLMQQLFPALDEVKG